MLEEAAKVGLLVNPDKCKIMKIGKWKIGKWKER